MNLSNLLDWTNNLFALGTFVVFAVSLVVSIPRTRNLIPEKILNVILAIASFFVIAAPLTYTYFFGFPACTFCWYQRIFMWPMAIMGTLMLFKKASDRAVVYSNIRWLAPIGLVFSVWHYLSQWGLSSTASVCGAVGQSVSCDGIDVITWGFVTIPFMAGIGFISLFLLLTHLSRISRK